MQDQLMRYLKKLEVMTEFGDGLRSLGTDPRIKVGAIVFPVDCSAVLGLGYNGAASGLDHGSVVPREPGAQMGTGVSGAAHAEANALIKANLGDGYNQQPCLMYTTLAPCPYCAPLIANSMRIRGVIIGEELNEVMNGVHVLLAAGVPVVMKSKLASLQSGMRDETTRKIVTRWMMSRPRR